MIVEAANGPTTPKADKILVEKGVELLLVRKRNKKKLEKIMTTAFDSVYKLHKDYDVKMREAAYMMAIKRLTVTLKLKGKV